MDSNETNSSVQETVTDNSSTQEYTQEDISKALDEPVNTEENTDENKGDNQEEEKKEEQKDNTLECPDKFKNKDGTPNIEKVLKSYKELEPLINEKASWTKEREELLKVKSQLDEINKINEKQAVERGYESAEAMQQEYNIANFEANEYAKYLQYTEEPEEVRKLLVKYANNPSEELMEQIEVEFAPEINKRVAIESFKLKQNYTSQKQKNAETQKYMNIENVISKSVESNSEIFKYEPFKNLFTKVLDRFGDNFTFEDAQVLMGAVNDLKTAFREEYEKESNAKYQNNNAINNIASINTTSSPGARQFSNEDIDKMSSNELAKEIRKYL